MEDDQAEAASWYRKAAEQGHAEAQHNLGIFYSTGIGVKEDLVQAASWYRKAAEQGFAKAQLKLGFLYSNGLGVPKDFVQATSWYRKSAEQGDAEAQYNLGLSYAKGEGVPKDEIEAYAYWNLAGITNEAARKFLGLLEDTMSQEARLLGQQRTRQLQKEIEGRLENLEDLRKSVEKEKLRKGS